MNENAIAILGGTGDQGLGLALRFTKAGRPVVIGSRKAERALEAAEKVREAQRVYARAFEDVHDVIVTKEAPNYRIE